MTLIVKLGAAGGVPPWGAPTPILEFCSGSSRYFLLIFTWELNVGLLLLCIRG